MLVTLVETVLVTLKVALSVTPSGKPLLRALAEAGSQRCCDFRAAEAEFLVVGCTAFECPYGLGLS